MFNELKAKVKAYFSVAKAAQKFADDESAKVHGAAAGKVVGLFIIAILAGTLFVEGITQMESANTTTWTTTEVTLFAIVALILIVGLLWLILKYVELV